MEELIKSESFKTIITIIFTGIVTILVNSFNNKKLLMNRKKEEIAIKCKELYLKVMQSLNNIRKDRMCIYDEKYIDELTQEYNELRLFSDIKVIEMFALIYNSILSKNKEINEIDPNFHSYLDNIDNYEVDEDGARPPSGICLTPEEEDEIEKRQFATKVSYLFDKDELDKLIDNLFSAMRIHLSVDDK